MIQERFEKLWRVTLFKAAAVLAAAALIYLGIDYYGEKELDAIARRATKSQKQLIALELATFRTTSNLIASLIFDKETSRLMYEVTTGRLPPERVREKLLQRYAPLFAVLKRHNVKHLQFHLPDGRSFLRVHEPKIWGDSLLKIRPSVVRVMRDHRPLFGFEVGRYLGAYRAVFPLFYRGRYVGSVEISFTFDVMKEVLEKVAHGRSYYYLALNFDLVKKSARWNLLHRYRRCCVDPRFVIDEKMVRGCRELKETGFHTSLIPYREFSTILRPSRGDFHIVSFIPLQMIDGRYGGYYIVNQKDDGAIGGVVSILTVAKVALALVTAAALLLIVLLHIYRKRAYVADIDALTGIYNRRGCMSRLGEGPYGLIFIDLDRFKEINDTHGHDKGDEVLRAVTRIVTEHSRKEDVFCRHGGDEFLLFVSDVTLSEAEAIARKLLDRIRLARIEGVGSVGVSIGVAVRRPAEPIRSLIERADRGLYEAKERGRGQVVVVR